MVLNSGERLQAGFGLEDAGEAEIAAEDGHGIKQRRRVLASADGNAVSDPSSRGGFAGRDGLGH